MIQLTQKLVLVLAVAIGVVLVVQYLRLLQPAQARAVKAACNGLQPSTTNAAFKNMSPELMAPDFSLVDQQGNTVKLSDFRGKVVVVNFWASWCSVCRSEKPSLEEFQADSDEIVVLALASDDNWAKVNRALLGFDVVSAKDVLAAPKKYGIRDPKDLSASGEDVVVSRIDSGRAAVDSGLRWLDHITSVNGTAVATVEDLDTIMRKATGDLTLEIMHKGRLQTVKLKAHNALQVLLDKPGDGGNLGQIAKNYGITAVPESFVVDRSGKIRHYFINKRNWTGDVAKTCMQDLIDE